MTTLGFTTETSTPLAAGTVASIGLLDEAMAKIIPMTRLNGEREGLRTAFRSAAPFPHFMIDGLWDEDVLDRILAEWPKSGEREWITWDTQQELKQTSKGMQGLSSITQLFMLQLCAEPFLSFLRDVTGFADLVPDPSFFGAGLHECFRGGWLDIHGDYVQHPVLPLARRINVLIYLNHDWDPSWGGDIELWDPATRTRAASFAPIFNRTVVFNTTSDALHGHPAPLACPQDRSRKLLSLYYWSADPEMVRAARPINFVKAGKKTPPLALRSFVPPIVLQLRDAWRARNSG